jgi:hypothetical protein
MGSALLTLVPEPYGADNESLADECLVGSHDRVARDPDLSGEIARRWEQSPRDQRTAANGVPQGCCNLPMQRDSARPIDCDEMSGKQPTALRFWYLTWTGTTG